ncbi:hypothetical protein CYLTODRAFT_494515 [Cylindrobasidium torrendii FP15055 ss-10]|uniref:Uncharacterized protein n=1 Tax=Cylindrobasidium torrendii FP15055 ss-10 TaxID=1314674 RepID=A0A0D7AW53_9AGAR|nr:hypothetical protein CYLTODRAFT_494515 [Cylindrobasidium torrendii FP15055 ss-10]
MSKQMPEHGIINGLSPLLPSVPKRPRFQRVSSVSSGSTIVPTSTKEELLQRQRDQVEILCSLRDRELGFNPGTPWIHLESMDQATVSKTAGDFSQPGPSTAPTSHTFVFPSRNTIKSSLQFIPSEPSSSFPSLATLFSEFRMAPMGTPPPLEPSDKDPPRVRLLVEVVTADQVASVVSTSSRCFSGKLKKPEVPMVNAGPDPPIPETAVVIDDENAPFVCPVASACRDLAWSPIV